MRKSEKKTETMENSNEVEWYTQKKKKNVAITLTEVFITHDMLIYIRNHFTHQLTSILINTKNTSISIFSSLSK